MSRKWKGNLILAFTALIWGNGFAAQSEGADLLSPFTFNAVRYLVAGIVMLPVIAFFDARNKKKGDYEPMYPSVKRNTIIGGIINGILLAAASGLQQIGVGMTTAGKAGFITALYIIIVPLLGIVIGKKIPAKIWFCAVLAVTGFYLLCVKEGFSVSKGDLIVLLCSVCYSLHIIVTDIYIAKGIESVRMSTIQFWTVAVISAVLCLVFETPTLSRIAGAWVTIAYMGILGSGVAYTLQIIGQENADPTSATLFMSLESVFAAIAGWLFLNEKMSVKEIAGCAIVFAAVILAQIPLAKLDLRKRKE